MRQRCRRSKVWNTELYHEQLIKGYVCWRCWKKLKIHCKGCNEMYIEGVKRDSKYTIRAHNVFAHNFLNIQLIFNLRKVLESWDSGLFNHIMMYVKECWRCRRSKYCSSICAHGNVLYFLNRLVRSLTFLHPHFYFIMFYILISLMTDHYSV